MDAKVCLNCRCPHFEDYDLYRYCADELQCELEERLRDDDGAYGFAVIAAWALFGVSVGPNERRWWVR